MTRKIELRAITAFGRDWRSAGKIDWMAAFWPKDQGGIFPVRVGSKGHLWRKAKGEACQEGTSARDSALIR